MEAGHGAEGGPGAPGQAAGAAQSGHPQDLEQPGHATAAQQMGPRAGFGKRLLAALLDFVVIGAIGFILGFVLALVLGEQAGAAISNVLGLVIGIAYYAGLEGGARGQTLGKRALGIRVIDFNGGGPIGFGRGVIRYLGRLVSGIVIFLGYLWMLWDDQKQTWHDKFASAVVVPVDAYPIPPGA